MKIALIGIGKMGGAILNGLVKEGTYTKNDLLLIVHQKNQKDQLIEDGYNVSLNVEDAYKADVLILCVKPQKFNEVFAASNNFDFLNKLIISIAAGISLQRLSELFKNASYIRAMPNTSALIGKSMTTMCYQSDEKSKDLGKKILSSFGQVEEIKESMMDATLPLNGSMPAYIYYFVKCFVDSAVAAGLSLNQAKSLTINTISASMDMLKVSQDDLKTLIDNVCSKGGTTIAGLDKLMQGNMPKIIDECYNACKDRSKELNGK